MIFNYIAMILATSAVAQAAAPFDGETSFKITGVLQGDAGTFTDRTGEKSGYFHLLGCATDAPGVRKGNDAKAALAESGEGKLADFVFAKGSDEKAPDGHYLVVASVGGKDLCKGLIEKGLAFYRKADEAAMSSVTSGAYYILERRARLKKQGVWASGGGPVPGAFVERPGARFELGTYRYEQSYVNGVPDPTKNGFDRPAAPKPAADHK